MAEHILNKEIKELTFKERQVIVDYFTNLVNKEFEKFKDGFLHKDKAEIFERAYLIDTYDNIRIRLISLSFFTIVELLKYQKDGFIDYMYNMDVNDGVFDYYDSIENRILIETSKLKIKSQNKKVA